MGGEILVFAMAGLGLALFAFLCFRSVGRASRPYALPTLAACVIAALFPAWGSTPANFPFLFFAYFPVAAVVFGAHAHAIRWLRERGGEEGNSHERA